MKYHEFRTGDNEYTTICHEHIVAVECSGDTIYIHYTDNKIVMKFSSQRSTKDAYLLRDEAYNKLRKILEKL